mmetsp:Transcript_3530/g.5302  ORF Transcript_3530/g.5302 Transcript_3530/m.5302 type:complete len:163 (+) Transcript_3530:153-641(+)
MKAKVGNTQFFDKRNQRQRAAIEIVSRQDSNNLVLSNHLDHVSNRLTGHTDSLTPSIISKGAQGPYKNYPPPRQISSRGEIMARAADSQSRVQSNLPNSANLYSNSTFRMDPQGVSRVTSSGAGRTGLGNFATSMISDVNIKKVIGNSSSCDKSKYGSRLNR